MGNVLWEIPECKKRIITQIIQPRLDLEIEKPNYPYTCPHSNDDIYHLSHLSERMIRYSEKDLRRQRRLFGRGPYST